MGLLSILPASFSTFETWLTRMFLVIGLVMIGPWAVLVTYDLVLYVFRAITYEIPLVGGRARGKARPRAPSLTERPSGRPRRFSLARPKEDTGNSTGTAAADTPVTRSRHVQEGVGN